MSLIFSQRADKSKFQDIFIVVVGFFFFRKFFIQEGFSEKKTAAASVLFLFRGWFLFSSVFRFACFSDLNGVEKMGKTNIGIAMQENTIVLSILIL